MRHHHESRSIYASPLCLQSRRCVTNTRPDHYMHRYSAPGSNMYPHCVTRAVHASRSLHACPSHTQINPCVPNAPCARIMCIDRFMRPHSGFDRSMYLQYFSGPALRFQSDMCSPPPPPPPNRSIQCYHESRSLHVSPTCPYVTNAWPHYWMHPYSAPR